MSATETNTRHGAKIENWRKEPIPDHLANQFIEAWNEGVEHGKGVFQRTLQKAFNENLAISCKLSEALYNFITKEKNARCSLLKLKYEDLENFKSLFVVEAEKYNTSAFRKEVYSMASSLRKEARAKDFDIDFILMAENEDLNISELHCEGYTLTYNSKREVKPSRSRKA